MGRAARQGLVFESTATAFDEIEAAHDLFWCAAVSMWNTRAEVIGFRAMAPDIGQKALGDRMSAGSGLSGSNVVTATDRFTWDEQLSELALLRLVQLMAHFEGWLETLAQVLVTSRRRRGWVKDMTFPSACAGALAELGTSQPLTALFRASKPHGYRIDSVVTEAMVCVRYFKEVRNCAIHSGRRASAELLAAQAAYSTVAQGGSLATAYRPPTYVPVAAIEDRLSVSHHGILGLTGLTQRLMATIDALVAMSNAGEAYYLDRWKRTHGAGKSLPGDAAKRTARIASMAGKVGPRPTSRVPAFERLLKQNKLVNF